MTIAAENKNRTYSNECATCHAPASLQSDANPFSLESDQWYECINGHITKNVSPLPGARARH